MEIDNLRRAQNILDGQLKSIGQDLTQTHKVNIDGCRSVSTVFLGKTVQMSAPRR